MTTINYVHKQTNDIKPDIADAIEKMKTINHESSSSNSNNYCIDNVQGKALHKVVSEKHKKSIKTHSSLQQSVINTAIATAMDNDNK